MRVHDLTYQDSIRVSKKHLINNARFRITSSGKALLLTTFTNVSFKRKPSIYIGGVYSIVKDPYVRVIHYFTTRSLELSLVIIDWLYVT